MVTRMIGRLHFDDLDPIRFEELCLSVIYRMRRWINLDHLGKLGSDGGVDIRACEQLENGKKNIHHFQCKRYTKLSKAEMRKIVADYKKQNEDTADYYYLVVACSLSKTNIDYFRELCETANFKNVEIWTASVLEAVLYSDYHDLLFAYFGVNMTSKRNDRIAAIRRNIDLKHKMHKDFLKSPSEFTADERKELLQSPWKKFRHSRVLIRSIYDTKYPENTRLTGDYSAGYFRTDVYDFYHNGLQVFTFPYKKTIKVKVGELHDGENVGTIEEMEVEVVGCVPFENIIAYDADGDEFYPYPHLFCDFPNGSDPFEDIIYVSELRMPVDKERIVEM